MRTLSLVGIAVCMIVGVVVPAAGARDQRASTRGRVEKVPYQAADGSALTIHSNFGLGLARVVLPGGPERFLSLRIEDSTGQPVAAEIVQSDSVADVCGSTEHPLRIEPNFDVTVTLYSGRCPDASPSIVTSGTVIATFLKRSPDPRVQVAGYSPYEGATGIDSERGYLAAEITFPAGPERFLSVVIADDSGAAIPAEVVQDDVVATFCGETAKPVRIRPNFPVTVEIFSGPCPEEGAGAATRGVVEATFSRHRS